MKKDNNPLGSLMIYTRKKDCGHWETRIVVIWPDESHTSIDIENCSESRADAVSAGREYFEGFLEHFKNKFNLNANEIKFEVDEYPGGSNVLH